MSDVTRRQAATATPTFTRVGEDESRPRLWPTVASAVCIYGLLVIPRLSASGALWFTHLGREFLQAANTSSVLSPALGATSKLGYDGQYYFAVAVDPVHAHSYIEPSISAGYVYARGLYPLSARLLGFGSVEGIAYALLLVNLVSVVAATIAIGSWLRRRGLSPAYALLYALFPGLVFAVFRDLTEPLAYGLVAVAVWLLDLRRTRAVVGAAALMALSLLTRETTAVFAVVLALSLIAGDSCVRPRWWAIRRGALFLAASTAPLLAWRAVITLWLGSATQERPGGGLSYLVPFHAYVNWWPWQPMRTLIVLVVAVPTVLATGVLALAWRDASERWPFVLFVLNAVVFIAYLPAPVLVDYGAAGRAALGAELALIYCLPVLLRYRAAGKAVAFVWSPLWYLIVAAALGWPAPHPWS